MSKGKKFDCKHLTTTQRIKIEKGLMNGESFASIARSIDKHPSNVAKEVKKYRYFPQREDPKKVLQCAHFKSCQMPSFVRIKTASNLVNFVTIRSFALESVPLFVLTIRKPSVLSFKKLPTSAMAA